MGASIRPPGTGSSGSSWSAWTNGRAPATDRPRGEQVAGEGADDLVFTGPNGAPLRHGNYYARHYRPTVEKLVADGVWPDSLSGLRFHDLRHTCAALMTKQGVHPKAIADRLGHSSIVIAMDRYGHMYDEHVDEIATDLDGVYKGAVRRRGRPR